MKFKSAKPGNLENSWPENLELECAQFIDAYKYYMNEVSYQFHKEVPMNGIQDMASETTDEERSEDGTEMVGTLQEDDGTIGASGSLENETDNSASEDNLQTEGGVDEAEDTSEGQSASEGDGEDLVSDSESIELETDDSEAAQGSVREDTAPEHVAEPGYNFIELEVA